MPRVKNCRETSFAVHCRANTLTVEKYWKRSPLLRGRGNLGEAFWEAIWVTREKGEICRKELSPRNQPNNCYFSPCHSFVRGLLGTGPPDPSLESASPSPPQGSIWHRFNIDSTSNRVKSGNRCRIDVESMLNRCRIDPWGGEGEADSRMGSGGSVPNKPLTIIVSNAGQILFSDYVLSLSFDPRPTILDGKIYMIMHFSVSDFPCFCCAFFLSFLGQN